MPFCQFGTTIVTQTPIDVAGCTIVNIEAMEEDCKSMLVLVPECKAYDVIGFSEEEERFWVGFCRYMSDMLLKYAKRPGGTLGEMKGFPKSVAEKKWKHLGKFSGVTVKQTTLDGDGCTTVRFEKKHKKKANKVADIQVPGYTSSNSVGFKRKEIEKFILFTMNFSDILIDNASFDGGISRLL